MKTVGKFNEGGRIDTINVKSSLESWLRGLRIAGKEKSKKEKVINSSWLPAHKRYYTGGL